MAPSAVRGGFAVLAGNVFIGLGSFATFAALARLLEPATFGRVSAALGLVNLCALLSISLGNAVAVRSASISAEDAGSFRLFIRNTVVQCCFGLAASTGLMFAFRGAVEQFLGITTPEAVVLGLACSAALVSSVPRGIVQGLTLFKLFAALNAVEVVIRFGACYLLTLALGGFGGILGFAVGSLVAFGIAIAMLMTLGIRSSQPGRLVRSASFDPLIAVGSMLVTAMTSIDIVIVGHVAPAVVTAAYAAVALVGRAEHFGLSAIATVLLPISARATAAGQKSANLFLAAFAVNAAAAVTIALCIVLFPHPFLNALVGHRYLDAGASLARYAIGIGFLSIAGLCTAYALSRELKWPVVIPLALAVLAEAIALSRFAGSLTGAVTVILYGHMLICASCLGPAIFALLSER